MAGPPGGGESKDSVNSRDNNVEPHVQEVTDDSGSPERPVVPRRSLGMRKGLRQSAVVDYTGEDQTVEPAEASSSTPVEQDNLNYSNWDDDEDDDENEGNAGRQKNRPVNKTMTLPITLSHHL